MNINKNVRSSGHYYDVTTVRSKKLVKALVCMHAKWPIKLALISGYFVSVRHEGTT